MQLQELSPDHGPSFLKMLSEFTQAREALPPAFALGDGPAQAALTPAGFSKFAKTCEKERLDWRPGPGKMSRTHYVLAMPDGRLIALGVLRFPLDERAEANGGNLVVAVPPELRRKNLASFCLSQMLFEAVRAGLRRVLVTCPSTDEAARRVIEKNRGELESADGIARYWIRFS